MGIYTLAGLGKWCQKYELKVSFEYKKRWKVSITSKDGRTVNTTSLDDHSLEELVGKCLESAIKEFGLKTESPCVGK